MSKKRLHFAQLQALRWLQGRVESQLVRSHIQTEIEMLQRVKYPIDSSGRELTFPKREKKPNVLPGQIDITEALNE